MYQTANDSLYDEPVSPIEVSDYGFDVDHPQNSWRSRISRRPIFYACLAFVSLMVCLFLVSSFQSPTDAVSVNPFADNSVSDSDGHYDTHNLHEESTSKKSDSKHNERSSSDSSKSQSKSKRDSSSSSTNNTSPLNNQRTCDPPYPGYPYCESKVSELMSTWNKDPDTEGYYRSKGIDGSKCSFLTYLNQNGFFCPEAVDWNRNKIRGVNLGGWLVLEPWITPSLFEQFNPEDNVVDQWTFCKVLGPKECKQQLEKHWNSWVTYDDLKFLAENGINHVRVPVGYWIFGDIRKNEPWVTGELDYLDRALSWCAKLGLNVVLDVHCAPGSQNGFDNSGKRGEVHFGDVTYTSTGKAVYPNIERALELIDHLTERYASAKYEGTVVAIELVNEAFVTIPIEVVKDFYLQGYDRVKKYGDLAVVIGDSFRFGAWNDFMFPPHYRHVWIDTHIYQVFDMYRLSFTWEQHLDQTCRQNKPEVAVAPLSTMVGEFSLATTDCAKWLNGYGIGARYDGSYWQTFPQGRAPPIGSCVGHDDVHNTTVYSSEFKEFLKEFAEKQMDAYESGSAAGWFFWNFKTENSPQWDYITGLKQGWMPSDHSKRKYKCD